LSDPTVNAEAVARLAARIDAEGLVRLGRSLALYPAAAGDCGGCALEWAMLRSAVHGLAPYGVSVQDTPVGADVLLLTGVLTRSMVVPVQRAVLAMAQPRWVVAVGDCAIDGGVFAGNPAVAGGAGAAVPVDLVIPGCPPTPARMLAGLRALLAANT
jgi:Ni,Fe-hydrogenase III small subunit